MQVKTHAAKAGPLLTLADDAACRCSQLLQRAACERALGVAFADVRLAVTKGRKPYLVRTPGAKCLQCRSCPPASGKWPCEPAARTKLELQRVTRRHAARLFWRRLPRLNVHVFAGCYVVLAAEPFCVCGVDVAAPGQLRRAGAPAPMKQYVQLFKHQLTLDETQRILAAGDEGMAHCKTQHYSIKLTPLFLCLAAQQDCFRKLWSLKEAFVKARGDGLALELGRAEFVLEGSKATVKLDGLEQPHWRVCRPHIVCLCTPLTSAAGVSRCSS